MPEEGSNPSRDNQEEEANAMTPHWGYVAGAYAIVVASGALALWLADKHSLTIEVTEGFAAFAVVYIVAQAVERFVQPFTYLVGKPAEKSDAKTELTVANGRKALADASNNAVEVAVEVRKAAMARKTLAVIQAERTALFWAIATGTALIACGVLDLGLIQSISDVTGGEKDKAWFDDVDILITGAVIGAGTKPLHDLIKIIQVAKQKSDPSESGSPS